MPPIKFTASLVAFLCGPTTTVVLIVVGLPGTIGDAMTWLWDWFPFIGAFAREHAGVLTPAWMLSLLGAFLLGWLHLPEIRKRHASAPSFQPTAYVAEPRKFGMGRVAAPRAPKPDIVLSEHGLTDLQKLVDVTLRASDAQFGTAAKAVIKGLETLQDEGKLEIRNLMLYLYKENQNGVMSQVASLIRRGREPPKSLEIIEKLVAYLEYYRNVQYRMVDVVAKRGPTTEASAAVQQWLHTDREVITQIQSLASAHLKDERLRQMAWDLGFANSRFSSFLTN